MQTSSGLEGNQPQDRGVRTSRPLRTVLTMAGLVAVGIGLLGVSLGSFWAPMALDLFSSNDVARHFELIVPFLPIFVIALGAALAVGSRR